MINANLGWLVNFKENIFNFIRLLEVEECKFFKYSYGGDLFCDDRKWGLGQLVFAIKILYMIDSLKTLSSEKIQTLERSIKHFGNIKGYISDPLISRLSLRARASLFIKTLDFEMIRNEQVRRAETRQATAALLCLGSKPEKPFLKIPYSTPSLENYLSKLDWNKPWNAGSHLSHFLFFCRSNQELFNYKSELSQQLICYAIDWVNKLQSGADGTWYKGETVISEKINGAMKILTGFSAVNHYQIAHVEKLIDTCLTAANDSQACDNFNIVYVLWYCSRLTDYKKDEIRIFFLDRLNIYKQYYHFDKGGFSFYKNRSNSVYYGAKISKGLDEPDIHGTVLFTWGISLISNVLDIGFKLKVPLT